MKLGLYGVFFLLMGGCTAPRDGGRAPQTDPGTSAKATTLGAYDFTTHAAACRDARAPATVPANVRCSRDSECGVCHDGSACGTILRTDEILRRSAACQKKDSAECELMGVHCCNGRCVETAVSGECKKGSYWVHGKCD